MGSFSYTAHAGFFSFFNLGRFLTHPMLVSFVIMGVFLTYSVIASLIFIGGVSFTYSVIASFLSEEFLLHMPCWLHFYLGNFCCTSRAVFVFMQGISLTHPKLTSFKKIFFDEGVFLTHPKLPSFLCGDLPRFLCWEFFSHIPCWL